MDNLKQMHGIMTKYLVDESGEYRTGEEGVFSGDKCIFMAPPAYLVPELNLAEQNNVNFSNVLQNALKEYLNVNN